MAILIGEEKDRDAVWVRRLYEELKKCPLPRDCELQILSVERLCMDIDGQVKNWPYGVCNRIPESSPPKIQKLGLAVLQYAELLGLPVFNPAFCYAIGSNKLLHHGILSACRLKSPKCVLVRSAKAAIEGAARLNYPLLLKPNSAGYGKGITRFSTQEELEQYFSRHKDSEKCFGRDGTALLQEYYESLGSACYRVWTLRGKIQCAIKVTRPNGGFGGACMSDSCSLTRTIVEAVEIDPDIQRSILKIETLCQSDCSSVEFLYNANKPDEIVFFDVNMLSTLPVLPNNKVLHSEKRWGEGYNPWKELASCVYRKLFGTLVFVERLKPRGT